MFFNTIVVALSDCVTNRLLIEEYESECKLKEIAESITRLHPRNISNGILSKPRNIEPTRDSDFTNQKQVNVTLLNINFYLSTQLLKIKRLK